MTKDKKYLDTYTDDLCTNENNIKTKVKYDVVNRFLLGNEFGFYGAPDKESYDEYIKKSKVDFNKTKTIIISSSELMEWLRDSNLLGLDKQYKIPLTASNSYFISKFQYNFVDIISFLAFLN